MRVPGGHRSKYKRKRRNYMDPDFDSEEEYNSEVASDDEDNQAHEDSSDVEYDDGKMSEEADDDGKMSDEADLLNEEEDDDYGDEELE